MRARLPLVSVPTKTDLFKGQGESANSFRLTAVAVAPLGDGSLALMDGVAPAVSEKFVVSSGGPAQTAWGPSEGRKERAQAGAASRHMLHPGTAVHG